VFHQRGLYWKGEGKPKQVGAVGAPFGGDYQKKKTPTKTQHTETISSSKKKTSPLEEKKNVGGDRASPN